MYSEINNLSYFNSLTYTNQENSLFDNNGSRKIHFNMIISLDLTIENSIIIDRKCSIHIDLFTNKCIYSEYNINQNFIKK